MGAGAAAEDGLSRSIKGVFRMQEEATALTYALAFARCESARSSSYPSALTASYFTAKSAGFGGTGHVHPLECSSSACFSASRDKGRKSAL